MSETQLYFLLHRAQAKLLSELSRPNHRLRILISHVNLLDTLILDVIKAEQKQELWFNQCVRGTTSFNKTYKRDVQRLNSIPEKPANAYISINGNFQKSGSYSSNKNRYNVSVAEIGLLEKLSLYTIEDGYSANDKDDKSINDKGDSEDNKNILAHL